jgi:S-formylglutathione hydrolase FrmB
MALIHCNFHSAALQLAASMDVILPQEPCLRGRRLPTLYLLHGLSDDHTIWQRRTSIERYVEPLGLAVVMPAVNRSFYADMAHGGRYWTFISDEVPAVSQALFPLSLERADTFVAGLSMGGYGAFRLGLRCPERFAAAASLSGALDAVAVIERAEAAWRPELADVFGEPGRVKGSSHDLFFLAEQVARRKRSRPRLYQCCGIADFLYEDNLRFRRHAESLGLDLTYEEGPGEHEWGYWDRQIQRVLAWLPLRGRRRTGKG